MGIGSGSGAAGYEVAVEPLPTSCVGSYACAIAGAGVDGGSVDGSWGGGASKTATGSTATGPEAGFAKSLVAIAGWLVAVDTKPSTLVGDTVAASWPGTRGASGTM